MISTLEAVDEILKHSFPVVLFIMLYKIFESVDKILKYVHSNENHMINTFLGATCYQET